MSDDAHTAVEAALKKKLSDLLAARADVRERIAALSRRDREIDRELADARAAARLFGIELEFPQDNEPSGYRLVRDADGNLYRQRTLADGSTERVRLRIRPPPRPTQEAITPPPPVPTPVGDSKPDVSAPPASPRPPIKDLVLDRLRGAAEHGSKAKPIRDFIERVYSEGIHEKTVGMTLYRLAKDGLVRREGRTWYLAEPTEGETRNPGAATPGPETAQS